MVQILITNHAVSHPPEKWGCATAALISPFDLSLSGDRLQAAEQMRARFIGILEKFHATVQSIERSLLQADPLNIHTATGSPELVEATIEELVVAARGTPWQDHWKRPEVQEAIAEIIESHFKTNQHLERLQWAADHPADVEAQNYKTSFE